MDYSLSEDDIRFLLKDKVKVLTYKDMYKSTTIDKLLSPYNCVVLLYEIYPNHGHWTLLYKMRNMVYFFDSYGIIPDDELEYVEPEYKEQLKENVRYLTKLIYNSPYDLDFNPYKFQSLREGVSTCGRWCVFRYLNKDLNIDDFHKEVIKECKRLKISKDKLVLNMIKLEDDNYKQIITPISNRIGAYSITYKKIR